MTKKLLLPVIFLLMLLTSPGSGLAEEMVLITGKTMGTTYHIKYRGGHQTKPSDLKSDIERCLEQINKSMSTYMKESEINRFNHLTGAGESLAVSQPFIHVMLEAKRLYRITGGSWDGTISPLVNLWGFGSLSARPRVPAESAIGEALKTVGFNHIEVDPSGYLRKKQASITVDLASIAKGFGVDAVTNLIKSKGIENCLVEIGGEVFASGKGKNGRPWRIGINRPDKNAALSDVYRVVSLENKAMATSGDYRNYFEEGGRLYSHIIDPGTGRPVSNGVVSASVISGTCTFADGLATALMVMGHKRGLALVNSLEGTECLIVIRNRDGSLSNYYSDKFP